MAKDRKSVQLVMKGSQVAGASAGSVAGALAGGLLAGLPGAMAGAAAAAKVCELVIEDVASRMLSTREQEKIGGVAAIAIEEIRERLLHEQPRDDGFFDLKPNGEPSPGEELFEGVLLTAKQEHEQKKLAHIAKLYANLVFKPYFLQGEANHLLAITEALTYDQICILAVVARREEFNLRASKLPEEGTIDAAKLDMAQQAFHLFQRQLLIYTNGRDGRVTLVLETTQFAPSDTSLTPTGKRLYELLSLSTVPESDLRRVASLL